VGRRLGPGFLGGRSGYVVVVLGVLGMLGVLGVGGVDVALVTHGAAARSAAELFFRSLALRLPKPPATSFCWTH